MRAARGDAAGCPVRSRHTAASVLGNATQAARRTVQAHRNEVERARATRTFLGDDAPAPAHRYDLADDVDDALPATAHVRGLRAVEEA